MSTIDFGVFTSAISRCPPMSRISIPMQAPPRPSYSNEQLILIPYQSKKPALATSVISRVA